MASLSNQSFNASFQGSFNMKINLLKLMGMPLAIWCLFTQSLNAHADLKLPSSKTVIKADINGNGTLDRVVATYFIRPVLTIDNYRAHTCKTVPGKFVRYTMYPNGRKNGKVIFEQQYGSILSEYWGHQLEIGKDLNRDGRKDLVFSVGDDTSSEEIYLLQQSKGFKAVSAGESVNPNNTIDSQRSLVGFDKKVLARWDVSEETWTSDKIGWVSGDCVAIRAQPDIQSKIVALGFDRSWFKTDRSQSVGDWIAINTDEGIRGWISKKHFSFSAPVRWFK